MSRRDHLVTRPVVRVVVVLAALLLAACASVPGDGPAPLVHIVLLQINDHYVLEPVDGGHRGGMARLATLVAETRRRAPHVVFALAGDTLSPSVMSTFLRGAQMVAALNAVGLDVATFGNHEFDFGPAVLAERMKEAKFVWVSTNVLDRRSGHPFGGARSELLRTFGGVSVGFLGLTTPDTAATSSPGPDVEFREAIAAGKAAAGALRARGARVVVAITHQDMAQDKALAQAADIDVILGGHEHEPLIAEEGKTLITKAGSDGRYLVRVDLWVTPAGTLVERSWTFREVSGRVPADPAVEELVRAYGQQMDRELDVVVGRTAVPLEAHAAKLRTAETNLGDFVADLMRERMGSHVALLNGGGIRTNRTVPVGPLTKRDVHGLLPFTNVVMVVELPGSRLRQALEHGVAQAEREGGGFLQVSGIRITWDPSRPAGSRIVSAEVGGGPMTEDARYTVAVPSYLVRGGDGFTQFAGSRVLVNEEHGPDLAGLVLQAIAARGTIAPEVDGRLRVVRP